MSRLTRALKREEGQGIVQALLLLAGVLLPLLFLVALFGRIEQGQQTGLPLSLNLQGELQRGATLTATTTVTVSLADMPFFGQLGTVTIHGQARAPVDQYRSLDPNAEAAP